jgi:hypothetical protein
MARINPSDVERQLREASAEAPPPDLLKRIVAEIPAAVPVFSVPSPVPVRRGWSVGARRLLAASILVTLTAAGLTWESRIRLAKPEAAALASSAPATPAVPRPDGVPGAAEPPAQEPSAAPQSLALAAPKPVPRRDRASAELSPLKAAPTMTAPTGGVVGGFAPLPPVTAAEDAPVATESLQAMKKAAPPAAVPGGPSRPDASASPSLDDGADERAIRAPMNAVAAPIRSQQQTDRINVGGNERFAGAAPLAGSGVEMLEGGVPQTLRMKVEDPFGRPLTGVSLLVSPRGDSAGGHEVATDASGWASAAPVTPGDYALRAALPGYLPSESTVAVGEDGAAVRVRLFPQPSGALGSAVRRPLSPAPSDRLAMLERRLAEQGVAALSELTVANLERGLDDADAAPLDQPVRLRIEGSRGSQAQTRWVRVDLRADSLLPGSAVEIRFPTASVEWVRRLGQPAREAVSMNPIVLRLRETGDSVAESWLFEVGLRNASSAEPVATVLLRTQSGQAGSAQTLSAASSDHLLSGASVGLRLAVVAADLASAAHRPEAERMQALQSVAAEAQALARRETDRRAEELVRIAFRALTLASRPASRR